MVKGNDQEIKKVEQNRDRRKFCRVLSDFPIQLQPVPQSRPGKIFNSLTQDVSEGGMKVSSFNFHPVNSRFMLEMLVSDDVEPIRSVGRVVWVEQLPYQDSFKLGIEFTDFSEEQKESLVDAIAKRLDNQPF